MARLDRTAGQQSFPRPPPTPPADMCRPAWSTTARPGGSPSPAARRSGHHWWSTTPAHTLLGQDGDACARPPPPDPRTPAKSVRRTTGGCLTQPRVPQPGQSCCQSGGHSTCTTSAGINPEHDDIWQAHRQLTHSGRDGLHRGPPGPGILVETDTGKTPVPHPPTTHPRPANTSPTRRLPPSPKHHMTPTAVRAVAAAAQALDLGTTVGHGYNRWT